MNLDVLYIYELLQISPTLLVMTIATITMPDFINPSIKEEKKFNKRLFRL